MHDAFRPFAKGNLSKTIALALIGLAAALFWGELLLSLLRILFGACLIGFLIAPIAKLFEKKLSPAFAALCAMVLAGMILLLLVSVLLPMMLRQFSGVLDLLPEAFARLQAVLDSARAWLSRRFPDLQFPTLHSMGLNENIGGMAKHTISYAGSLADGAYQLMLSVVLGYFLIAERSKVLLRAELAIPSPWRKIAVRMGASLSRELKLYLRGQASIALCVSLLCIGALLCIGVKATPLLGLLVGLFNVIPYFGPFIGGVPAFILALSESWQKALLTLLALLLVQQIDNLFLSPRIMGSITGFSPAIVLLSIFLGQQAFGVWGMLLAMPLLMSCRTVYRVFVQRHENN